MSDPSRRPAHRVGARPGAGRRLSLVDPSRALELGLTGYAANRPDGRVQVVAQGPRDACEQLFACYRSGKTPGHVDNVVVDWSPRGEAIQGFSER